MFKKIPKLTRAYHDASYDLAVDAMDSIERWNTRFKLLDRCCKEAGNFLSIILQYVAKPLAPIVLPIMYAMLVLGVLLFIAFGAVLLVVKAPLLLIREVYRMHMFYLFGIITKR